MVSIRELEDDFYEFDEENYCIVGRHHRKIYQLGDKINIRVAKANLAAKQLDFILADKADF
jgi:ribonuclease R